VELYTIRTTQPCKRYNRWFLGFALLCLAIIGAGCGTGATEPASEGDQIMTINLTSSAFDQGGDIPQKYTCDGDNLAPPLAWSGVPGAAQSLALIVDDPDAPGRTYVHWVLFNIPPEQDSLPEGVQDIGVQGSNNRNQSSYTGPCPPSGPAHRYFFKLYALDSQLDLQRGASKAELLDAMEGHIIAQGELMGKYTR
jgi:Raf kinase inhibitor-like YbhB/YbcL family protein